MKLTEKQQIEQQYYNNVEIQLELNHAPAHRWMWVRRFILCIILVTLFNQVIAPFYYGCEHQIEPDNSFVEAAEVSFSKSKGNKKPHTVLHTGFPPTENITGLLITSGKAAATAFSPNPPLLEGAIAKKSDESWWDRMFPNRHVHLTNLQLPIYTTLHNNTQVPLQVSISICESQKNSRFGNRERQTPNLKKCVNTAVVQSQVDDKEDLFSVLEYVPEVTIVLNKSKVYWIVVQSPSEPFGWVYSQDGSNKYGTAFETETGWDFKLDDEPVPSVMIMVEDHS